MKKVCFAVFLVGIIIFTSNLYSADVQEITVRQYEDLVSADPAYIGIASDYNIVGNIYSGLLRFNPKTFEPEPDLAKRWELSPDLLTYTFHLRDDVYWHKGYGKFTAKDVKYTFDRIMDKKTQSRYRADLENIREVEVVNDYTVKIHLKNPDMAFIRAVLYYRPGYIVNQKAIETLGKKYATEPIGTGPFIFQEWVPRSKVVLVGNKDYFLGAPKLKKATYLLITEENVAQMALEKGEVDMVQFRGLELRNTLKKDPSLEILENVGLEVTYLIMNNSHKPFDDVRVRRAIHHAINKKALVDVVYAGLAPIAPTILNPRVPGYNPDVRIYEFNPEKAKKLLAEAGYPQGFETSILYYPSEPWKDYAPIIQEQLRQVGIRLKLNMVDAATANQIRQKGEYDLLYGTYSRPPEPDIVFSSYFNSELIPFPNTSFYKNKEVDRLTGIGSREPNEKKRWEIYRKIQEIIAEDTPVIPINYRAEMFARKRYVKGYTYNSLLYYGLRDVYIEGRGK